ncbi:MAG: YbaB/EbfC family nucleoid-associated protein [Ruminococcaceae bacterium]|nr:YbaB/EbfC family nucleoid-associated protein [Oscillospiraceae bacterium]
MKARLPQGMGKGPGNMQDMLRQAQKMQADVAAKQAELEEREYTATAGGGMVTAVVDGKHLVKSLTIDPEAVDPDDVEMLADLITAAVNEAVRKATDTADEEMSAITAGMNIPGMPGLF